MKKVHIALIILPSILFIILAIFIQAERTEGFEIFVYNGTVAHMSPTVTKIVKVITHTGDPIAVILICFILLSVPSLKIKYGLPVGINVILLEIVNYTLKIIFARERPDILRLVTEKTPSFPSGHAMINSAIYIMLALCVDKYIKSKRIKYPIIIMCILYPFVIGFTRVYLGVHYITDVMGGWLLGISLTFVVFNMLEKTNNKEKD